MEELPMHQRDIGDIDKLLSDTVNVYATRFSQTTAWPYEVKADIQNTVKNARLSDSTTAMILAALLRLDRKFESPDPKSPDFAQWPSVQNEDALPTKLLENVESASALLLNKVFPPRAVTL